MKFSSATGITTFFLSALLGAAACGPDKDESPVEEAGEAIEEGAEEVGDEIDDAT
ncbi:MAG: hypothetical protein RL685_5566 [Pseudomonadota bacterium]|jgi:hypothetical protein